MICQGCGVEVDHEAILEYAERHGYVKPPSDSDVSACPKCLEGSGMPECPLPLWEQVVCLRRLGAVKLPSVEQLDRLISEHYPELFGSCAEAARAMHSMLEIGRGT